MTENKLESGTKVINRPKENIVLEKIKEAWELDLGKTVKLLQKTIEDWHREVGFASNAFSGYTKEANLSLASNEASLQKTLKSMKDLLLDFSESSKKLQEQTMTLALLPTKTHQALKELVPEIGKEVEKVHSGRLEEIIDHIKQCGQELKDNIWQSQKLIEDTTEQSIRKIEEAQLMSLESNKKQIADFRQFIKGEVEAITSNHGTKFLRNIGIALILATIAGGLTSWSVGTYFPRLVHIVRAGDITVNDSAVKILEGNNPKVNESNQKIKVTK